jgi:hypothetical protein
MVNQPCFRWIIGCLVGYNSWGFCASLVVNVFLLSVKAKELQYALLIFVLEPNIFEILSLPNFDDNPHI